MATTYPNHPTMSPTHFFFLTAAAAALLLTTTCSETTSYDYPTIGLVYQPLITALPVLNFTPRCWPEPPIFPIRIYPGDIDRLQYAENIEFLEAAYFLYGAFGKGLDFFAPGLVHGGPEPIGGRKANLDPETQKIMEEFGYQEIGHLRAIQRLVGWISRPLIDISAETFARFVDKAFERELQPPFDPYANSLNYWLGSYIMPYMGVNGYVGANPNINGYVSKWLLAGLLGVKAAQDGVIRKHLFDRAFEKVYPYDFTVVEFTEKVSILRNNLGRCGIKDEGLSVPLWLGAENRTRTNVLSADARSLSYPRTPAEILRVLYFTGDEHQPGGFYPKGANGRIARQYLQEYYPGGWPYDGGVRYEGTPYEGAGMEYDGGAPYNKGIPYESGAPYDGGAAYGGGIPYGGGAAYGGGIPYGGVTYGTRTP